MLGKKDSDRGGGRIFFAIVGIIVIVICLIIAINVFNDKAGKKDDKFSSTDSFIKIK